MTAWLLRMSLRDERLLHALVLRRRGWLDRVLRAVTHLGDATTTIPAAVVLLLLSRKGPGARVAFALAASHLAAQAVKRSVNRPRPHMPPGVESLVHAPDRFSFPSGHSAAALSIGLPIALSLPAPLAVPVVGVSLLVGVSRAYLGVHYPGDVLAGWALATAGTFGAAPALRLLSALGGEALDRVRDNRFTTEYTEDTEKALPAPAYAGPRGSLRKPASAGKDVPKLRVLRAVRGESR